MFNLYIIPSAISSTPTSNERLMVRQYSPRISPSKLNAYVAYTGSVYYLYIPIYIIPYTVKHANLGCRASSGQSRRRFLGTPLSSRTHGTSVSPPPLSLPLATAVRHDSSLSTHRAYTLQPRVYIHIYLFLSCLYTLLYSAPRTHARLLVFMDFQRARLLYDDDDDAGGRLHQQYCIYTSWEKGFSNFFRRVMKFAPNLI